MGSPVSYNTVLWLKCFFWVKISQLHNDFEKYNPFLSLIKKLKNVRKRKKSNLFIDKTPKKA